jgi:hypothetical protein
MATLPDASIALVDTLRDVDTIADLSPHHAPVR